MLTKEQNSIAFQVAIYAAQEVISKGGKQESAVAAANAIVAAAHAASSGLGKVASIVDSALDGKPQ